MRHVYSIVRYVPNVASGERVNLGLLAGSEDTGEWTLHAVGQRSRARQLGGDAKALAAVFEYLKRLTADLETRSGRTPAAGRRGECSEAWLRDLAGRQRGIVQFSTPLPVDADSAESAIDMLWSDLIVGPIAEAQAAPPPAPAEAHTKRAATSSVSRVLKQANIAADLLWTRPRLDAGGYSAPVDFAVHNGSAAFLVNCWSFQVRKKRLLTDIQSWAWAMRALRSNGGALSLEDGVDPAGEAPKDAELAVVYVPPRTGDDREAFETANGAFKDPDVRADIVVPYTSVSDIVPYALGAAFGRAP